MPGSSRLSRGPQLPYELLAGVEPCPGGWLLATAKLVGVQAHVDGIKVVPTFREILDNVPSYAVIALHVPIGLPEVATTGGRAAEREARKLLGFPRRGAILSAPTRRALESPENFDKASALNGGHLDVVTFGMLPKVAEIAREVESYHQRTVYEVAPELTYFSLNGDRPMRYPKRTQIGQEERREAVGRRLNGVARIYEAKLPRIRPWHLTDVAADLWTARRILGKGMHRLPERPEWNDEGLRMELVF